MLAKHDHQGRLVATGLYSASGSLTSTSDPTSVSTNRIGLSETAYDGARAGVEVDPVAVR